MKHFIPGLLIAVIASLLPATSRAQFTCDGVTYFCMYNGTITTCSGNFVDDGASNPYSDTPYTFTICPDNAGDVIQLDFVAFNLQTSVNPNNSDYLEFFDGDNTSYTSLGSYTSDDFQNHQVTGTINNITGCLTIVFDPNGQANAGSPGWQAIISCTTPCASPTSHAIISDPDPEDPNVQSVSVCLDVPISFSDNGSYAEPGFFLDQYIWSFDDGTIDTLSGPQVTHNFAEPGEYIVSLTVQDDNGCQNLNFEPLQILVSTVPEFPGIAALDTGPFYTCAETVTGIDANSVSNVSGSTNYDLVYPTWTALPPQVVSGTSYLADGAGFSYSTSLIFDFFEADAVLTDCSQLLDVFVNMEHSYMGDLAIFITCPDGTSVSLLNFPNSGGSLFIGGAIDIDDPNIVGTGYDYTWTTDATTTWNEWVQTNGYTYGESLPGGTYQAEGNLCDLVGCPLNGEWTFNVTDNQGIDDGFIFYWGLTFDPDLYPGITTFTPTAGAGADSTYWTGPYMTTDPNGDMMTINPPPGPGAYDYTYHVVNSFGCDFDTTITLTFQDALNINAGPDQFTACGAVELLGGFENQPAASCSNEGGVFNYCYPDNDIFTWTFCPDDPGDGFTFMTFTFLSGQAESCCDFMTVYDGDNTSAPIIASGITGTLTGQSWTATNSTGCITIYFDADFSVSCGGGSFTEWQYEVTCGNGGPQYVWEWTPANLVDNPNIPSPQVTGFTGDETVFTLTGYPVGFPECTTTDQVTVFQTADPPSPGEDGDISLCPDAAPVDLFLELNGTPDVGGQWYDPSNNLHSATLDPSVDVAGPYKYLIGSGLCIDFAIVDVTIYPIDFNVSDEIICIDGTATLQATSASDANNSWQYTWVGVGNGNGLQVQPTSPTSYDVFGMTDEGCTTETQSLFVDIYDPITIEMAPDGSICGGDNFLLDVNSAIGGNGGPYTFNWTANGQFIGQGQSFDYSPPLSGDYCVTVEDGCETPSVSDCIYVEVEIPIEVEFETDTTENCIPASFNFNLLVDPALYNTVSWNLGDGTTILNESTFDHTYVDPGSYSINILIISPAGCQYTLSAPDYITAHNLPFAAFDPNPGTTLIPKTEITFTDQSIGDIAEYYWEFYQGDPAFGTSTEQNPVFTYPIDGGFVYPVYMLVTDIHNCTDYTIGYVTVNDIFAVYIPNTFTPNGDGINDVFGVSGSDIQDSDFLLQVFNRWGDMVYESADRHQAWTGSNDSGDYFVPDGLYLWRVEAHSASTTEKIEMDGHVLLMR